ncbi:MAG TPA: hypothetical protein VGJ16_13065 [Pirellulales bacterium]
MDSTLKLVDPADSDLAPLNESLVAVSQPYVGRWSRLVSTTNWEKGRIIVEWRSSLVAQGLAATEFSDEAWGRLVGGVTGQHVGRLRRVFQRFGAMHQEFRELSWSHFQAALDWGDAEMWLEGAQQGGWSVAQKRERRWETLGKLAADQPRPEDVVSSETDEDFEPGRSQQPLAQTISPEYGEISGPRHEGPDFGEDGGSQRGNSEGAGTAWEAPIGGGEPIDPVRPFEDLPELPDDLAEAFDAMKLSLLRHKTNGWSDIPARDALRMLDALKTLVTAP